MSKESSKSEDRVLVISAAVVPRAKADYVGGIFEAVSNLGTSAGYEWWETVCAGVKVDQRKPGVRDLMEDFLSTTRELFPAVPTEPDELVPDEPRRHVFMVNLSPDGAAALMKFLQAPWPAGNLDPVMAAIE